MLFSQQVKWNHFIMTSVYYIIYTKMYINSLFHRDETKPTHIKGINSFLFLMQLVYKHSSPNYQHMTNYRKLINKMLLYIYICVSWNIFNRIHFFAICDVIWLQFIRFYMWILFYVWSWWKLTKQLRKPFFYIILNIFHNANTLHQHSHTSRTIASSQYHPRETRPLLSHTSQKKKSYIGLAYYEFASYIEKRMKLY